MCESNGRTFRNFCQLKKEIITLEAVQVCVFKPGDDSGDDV